MFVFWENYCIFGKLFYVSAKEMTAFDGSADYSALSTVITNGNGTDVKTSTGCMNLSQPLDGIWTSEVQSEEVVRYQTSETFLSYQKFSLRLCTENYCTSKRLCFTFVQLRTSYVCI